MPMSPWRSIILPRRALLGTNVESVRSLINIWELGVCGDLSRKASIAHFFSIVRIAKKILRRDWFGIHIFMVARVSSGRTICTINQILFWSGDVQKKVDMSLQKSKKLGANVVASNFSDDQPLGHNSPPNVTRMLPLDAPYATILYY